MYFVRNNVDGILATYIVMPVTLVMQVANGWISVAALLSLTNLCLSLPNLVWSDAFLTCFVSISLTANTKILCVADFAKSNFCLFFWDKIVLLSRKFYVCDKMLLKGTRLLILWLSFDCMLTIVEHTTGLAAKVIAASNSEDKSENFRNTIDIFSYKSGFNLLNFKLYPYLI